jgi:hypothetical protein
VVSMNKRFHNILDSAASLHIPDNLSLFPNVAAKLSERKTFMQTMRARPALSILIAVLALLLLTGVAYAIGRSLGYIPGVGVVEQGMPIRVLEKPICVTRNGITLTVTSAVLTTDKTVIEFRAENVPWGALSHNENVAGCSGTGELHLPNGTVLKIISGSGSPEKTRFVYAPIPTEMTEVTFVLPCVINTLPGRAPENWELSLRFVPAPSDMTVVPVIEVETPATTESSQSVSPVQVTQALQVGDEYVVVGTVPDRYNGVTPPNGWVELTGVRLTDANGEEVYVQVPTVEGLHGFDWGVQFKAGTVQFPVMFAFDWVRIAAIPDSRSEFEFDAGDNPQPGQEWTFNQPIQIGGRTIRLETVRIEPHGYKFKFTCDPEVTGLSVDISGYTPVGAGGGGAYGLGEFSVSQTYPELPKGKLHVVLSRLMVANAPQTWTMQWSPENPPEAAPLYGISLKLDNFIPLDDGYYLVGHTEWTDERIASVAPAGWEVKAYDRNGTEVPLEPVVFDKDVALVQSLGPNQWAFHIFSKAFNAPITLRATHMSLQFKQPVKMTLDLRPYNFSFSEDQIGIPWKFGLKPLDIPGIQASAFKATYIKEGDLRGFEIGIQADPALRGIQFIIESGLNTEELSSISGGGGWSRDETTGLIQSRVLTNAKMTFPIVLGANGAALNGDWQVTWEPPAAEVGETPTTMQQACVTLDTWKQAAGSSEPIPLDISQKVLVSRGALWPEPSLFISNLDGSTEQALVFGQGRLSPDDTKLVYSGADGNLYLMDMATKQNIALTTAGNDRSPFWSADGSQIVFTRYTNKGANIFVMDNNGQNVRALTDTTNNITLYSWMPGSRALIFSQAQQDGSHIQMLDVDNGVAQDLMVLHDEPSDSISVSPDGKWIAFAEKVLGRMTPGIFISRLDGSEKRLLVQLDYWVADRPRWSPDGKWLSFEVMDMDQMTSPPDSALVNVETCQIVPLNMLNGTIEQWLHQ